MKIVVYIYIYIMYIFEGIKVSWLRLETCKLDMSNEVKNKENLLLFLLCLLCLLSGVYIS